ncbi:MAG: 30S ribosomal protein S6 [Acidobacteria bacterium]|nr:30S ribosomal protein S6 [Acidobacteriota bacterium]|tara:strand:- start:782 stop:1333 length:552 start_codon:yes stop_codon:yes gene_type:complete
MPSERQYELVYIVAPTATDAEVESLQQEFDELIEKLGGGVEETDVWGRRKLAYEIGHFNEGIYIVQLVNGPAEMVSELGRRLRVRDQVLRYMTVRVDEDLRKSRRATERRKATVARRREARGLPPVVEVKDESESAAPVPEVPASEPAPEPTPATEAAPVEPSDDGVGSEESEKDPEVSNEEE